MTSLRREGRTVVCTIVAKNYLHFARALMASVRSAHPDWDQVVLLADEGRGQVFMPEAFELVDLEVLSLPSQRRFCYRYTLVELSTAVKPWLIQWLFRRDGVDRVVYLDPDIFVYQPLRKVENALADGALLVLTPHLTRELDDDKRPSEQDILRAGTYNLGFLALGRHAALPRFLSWWQRKLEFDCRNSPAEGLFVDQRWMDLVPGLFSDVHILRDEGYNVAYWNLKQRGIERADGQWRVKTGPLVFFHFSGIDPLAPTAISCHQDRLHLRDLGPGRQLLVDYCRTVLDNGFHACRRSPYAFARLNDGTHIVDSMRHLYRRDHRAQELAGDDPFAHDHAYLNEPWEGRDGVLVTRLMRQLWEDRPDLREAFPDIAGAHRGAYADWFVNDYGRREGLPEHLTKPVAKSLRGCPGSLDARWPVVLVRWTVIPLARILFAISPRLAYRESYTRKYALLRRWSWLLPVSIRRALKVELRQLLEWRLRQGPALPLVTSLLALGRSILHRWSRVVATVIPHSSSEMHGPALSCTSSDRPPEAVRRPVLPVSAHAPGVNIVGYVQSESGIGESVRLCAGTAEAAGLPFSLHEVVTGDSSRAQDNTWAHRVHGKNVHRINLLHVNADVLPEVRSALGDAFFDGRYTIGFWHWEMPEFPASMAGRFELIDEVWVPSCFVRDALQPKSSRPVFVVPHAVDCAARPGAARASLGLPEDRFLFLAMSDVNSVTERKNPEGAIEAFRKAFPRPGLASLIVKINNGWKNPKAVEHLRQRLEDRPDVLVIDRILSRQEIYDLEGLCDAYISLHRSEGFGLGLAEAMCLGKVALATNWSGNLEFMTEENSCLVDYNLTRLERDYGAYPRGQWWAEPDLEHAAWFMRKLVAEPGWARVLAARGRHTIRTDFSPAAIGRLYRERLDAIEAARGERVALSGAAA